MTKLKHFTSIDDVSDVPGLVQKALDFKRNGVFDSSIGKGKTIGLVFMNPSLRTRISSQKAARMLGAEVMVMNMDKEGWALEFEDEVVMNETKVEHIKDAAAVLGTYCDIIGFRSFPGLVDRDLDYSDFVFRQFQKYAGVPMISLESATRHPLQSFADLMTIEEHKKKVRPKVVLAWAPHIKALPQAVPNSFSEWMNATEVDFHIAQPQGYELHPNFQGKAKVHFDLEEGIQDADFVYVKNWSSYTHYGQMPEVKGNWLMDLSCREKTNQAGVMHCLPVRRGLELSHELLDSPHSLVIQQAENRLWSALTVMHEILRPD